MAGTLAVALGGAAGSVLRYWATLGAAWLGWGAFPWSTIAINVAGSFAIGWFATAHGAASHEVRLLVMTGLCGGFTTFSAFSLQTLDLLRAGNLAGAAANVLLSVALCLAAVFAGHALAMRGA